MLLVSGSPSNATTCASLRFGDGLRTVKTPSAQLKELPSGTPDGFARLDQLGLHFETGLLSLAHTEADLDDTLTVFEESLSEI